MDLGVKYGKCMCEMDPEFKEKMMKGGGSFWRSFVRGMKKGAQMALPVVAVTNPELAPAVMAGEAALQQGGGKGKRKKRIKKGGCVPTMSTEEIEKNLSKYT